MIWHRSTSWELSELLANMPERRIRWRGIGRWLIVRDAKR